MSFDESSTPSVRYQLISDFEGYRVGDDGSVWSLRTKSKTNPLGTIWHRLNPSISPKGYPRVHLKNKGVKTSCRFVHRLVLDAFVGPKPDGWECRHLDGNSLNNSLSNICWGTRQENATDRINHGTQVRGTTQGSSKFHDEDIVLIRAMCASGTPQKVVGILVGSPQPVIGAIVRRVRWKHIP